MVDVDETGTVSEVNRQNCVDVVSKSELGLII